MSIEHIKMLGQAMVLMTEEDFRDLAEKAKKPSECIGQKFGEFLRLARFKAKVSQKYLAKHGGWFQPFQSEVERGIKAYSFTQVQKAFKIMKFTCPSRQQLEAILSEEVAPNDMLTTLGGKARYVKDEAGKVLREGDQVRLHDGAKAQVFALCPAGLSPLDANPDKEAHLVEFTTTRSRIDRVILKPAKGALQILPTRMVARIPSMA